MYDFIVLGAGLAGLSFSAETTRLGRSVLLLERDAQVGGLARTIVFGDYRFDLGGHRFHSTSPEIIQWVRELVAGDMLEVARRSHIHLNGHYVDYPIQFPNALTALGPIQAATVVTSYVWASLRQHTRHDDVSFEDWVVRRFGRTLYEIYFRPYTEKVWGMPCNALSADWASQRIQLPSLSAAVKASLSSDKKRPATLISRFLYPSHGIGTIAERLAQRILASGRAAISLNSRAFRLERDEDMGLWRVHYRHKSQGEQALGRQVISTIPLSELLQILPANAAPAGLADKLRYRGLICVFLAIEGSPISTDTWTYYPEPWLLLGRTHEPRNWSRLMAPPDSTSLCAEIFCSEGDDVWNQRDSGLIERVVAELSQLGLLARRRVRQTWLARVPHAYPVYTVGYGEALREARSWLNRWPTLHVLGRTGSFQYLNMDSVIKQAWELAGQLAKDDSRGNRP